MSIQGIAIIVALSFWIITFAGLMIAKRSWIDLLVVVAIGTTVYNIIEASIPPVGSYLLLASHIVLWLLLIYAFLVDLRRRLKKHSNIDKK